MSKCLFMPNWDTDGPVAMSDNIQYEDEGEVREGMKQQMSYGYCRDEEHEGVGVKKIQEEEVKECERISRLKLREKGMKDAE